MERALVLALLLTACGSSKSRPDAPCGEEGESEACGQPCTDTRPCPFGLYCNDRSECDTDCIVDGVCGAGMVCGDEGQCVMAPEPPPNRRDQGTNLDSGIVCASREVRAGRTTPTVMLIIDQSSSMDDDFGGSNRWDALRNSLLDQPDGFIASLQDQVVFGLTLFSGEDDNPVCPLITTVPPALNNYDRIAEVYRPADTIEDTPTGDSIDAVIDDFLARPDGFSEPVIFVLATDGEPDTCAQLDPQEGQPESIAAVRRAFDNNIQTFVISVGEGVVSENHLQDIANAGLGRGAGDADAPFFVAGDDEGLRDALSTIIGGALSCTIRLEGRINTEAACTGTVMLNGLPLPCNDENGWRAVDESRIELQGEACDRLLNDSAATLRAEFPCDVILI